MKLLTQYSDTELMIGMPCCGEALCMVFQNYAPVILWPLCLVSVNNWG